MINAVLAIALALSSQSAEECPKVPNEIGKAIGIHIHKLRADEYCTARSVRTEGNITVALYTAEGACRGFRKKAKAGSCSNKWVRYMVGTVDGKIIGPIAVGGKGGLSDSDMKINGDVVELTGMSVGPDDAECCPSVPQTKRFEVSRRGFHEIR